jgi:hypothetical protein
MPVSPQILALPLLPRERGVAIMRGDEQLGGIYPAYASFPHRPLIYANF